MYKFFGKPLQIVTSKKNGVPIFIFDTKGEHITDDKKVIERAKLVYDYIENDVELVRNIEKPIKKPGKPEKESSSDGTLNIKHCKKCDFTCETQSALMTHYKLNHKKGA